MNNLIDRTAMQGKISPLGVKKHFLSLDNAPRLNAIERIKSRKEYNRVTRTHILELCLIAFNLLVFVFAIVSVLS